MKWVLPILCAALSLQAAEIPGVRTVYIMPMSGGLDQYLANRLVNAGVFEIVTEPQKADAVFADRLGEALEARLDELHPVPPPPPPPEPTAEEKEAKSAGDAPPPLGDTANKIEAAGRFSSFGRAKGNVFLVHVRSRQVLWSTYEPPRNSTAKEVDRAAIRIVSRLKKFLSPN
jgi:hypothetical protein